jgi:hypothetical protein
VAERKQGRAIVTLAFFKIRGKIVSLERTLLVNGLFEETPTERWRIEGAIKANWAEYPAGTREWDTCH